MQQSLQGIEEKGKRRGSTCKTIVKCGIKWAYGSVIPIPVSGRQPNLAVVYVNTLINKDIDGDPITCAQCAVGMAPFHNPAGISPSHIPILFGFEFEGKFILFREGVRYLPISCLNEQRLTMCLSNKL